MRKYEDELYRWVMVRMLQRGDNVQSGGRVLSSIEGEANRAVYRSKLRTPAQVQVQVYRASTGPTAGGVTIIVCGQSVG